MPSLSLLASKPEVSFLGFLVFGELTSLNGMKGIVLSFGE
jgi:hypothetical protein